MVDGNLAMQNNRTDEEPAGYFQRIYGLRITDSAKYESAYIDLIDCGAKISMDEFMSLVNKKKI